MEHGVNVEWLLEGKGPVVKTGKPGPAMSWRRFARACPVPATTDEESSFTTHVSPEAMSKPALAIRSLAAAPAWNQELPVELTQLCQAE